MESEGKEVHALDISNQSGGSGPAIWTSAMSSFMLEYLANLIASGTRTSSGFKKVHFNMCARAVNEHFKTSFTGDQIKNHLKTWQRKYQKINRLRNLSASGWDGDNFIITLDHEHYTSYVKDHNSDATFLNKPLENFAEMATIFGNSMATSKYAKGSNQPLGTEDIPTQEGEDNAVNEGFSTPGASTPVIPDDPGATSSADRPSKRTKTSNIEDDNLVGVLKYVGDKISSAVGKVVEKVAAPVPPPPPADEGPDDLLDVLTSLPGFEETHISFYFAYLVANPRIARAFYKLPFNHKLNWVPMYIADKFLGC